MITDDLAAIIHAMKPTEAQQLRSSFTKRTLYDKLFRQMRENPSGGNQDWMSALNLMDNSNEFYQIKNILKRKVESFLIEEAQGNRFNERQQIMNDLYIAEYCYRKNLQKQGEKYIRSIEKKASKSNDHGMLLIAYNELFHDILTDSERITLERLESYEKTSKDVTTLVQHNYQFAKLFLDILSKKFQGNLHEEIRKIVDSYESFGFQNVQNFENVFETEYRLMEMLFKIRYDQDNLLEDTFLNMFKRWEDKQFFNEGNHNKKLRALNNIALLQIFNAKHKEATKTLKYFSKEMMGFEGALLESQKVYYHLLSGMNNFAQGKLTESSKEFQDYLVEEEKYRPKTPAIFLLLVCHARTLYYLSDYDGALELIIRLTNDPEFGQIVQTKRMLFLGVFECMCNWQLGNEKYVKHKAKYILKKLRQVADQAAFANDLDITRLKLFMPIYLSYLKKPSAFKEKINQEQVDNFIATKTRMQLIDFETISLNVWVRANWESGTENKYLLDELQS